MDETQKSTTATKSSASAASIDPAAADLSAYFHVMRLGDPSSPREQPKPQPQPPQVPVPAMRTEVLMQQLQTAAAQQYYPQPQSYGVGESSTGAEYGYVPPYASCSPGSFYASHFDEHSPRLNAPAAPIPTVTPKLSADAGYFDTIAGPSHPSEPNSSSTPSPSPSASHYHLMPSAPQHGAAACFPWDDNSSSSLNPYASAFGNSSLNPYASAFQSTLHAYPVDYGSWMLRPEVRSYPTLEQVRSRLLLRPMEPDLLMFPETAAHVARLLVEGDWQVRRSVLARVRHDVRSVTGSNERHAVLLAMIRACAGRPDELQDIVDAVYKVNGHLMGVSKKSKHSHGLGTLEELIRAVVPHPQLLVQLICWLLREDLMEHFKGAELLQQCFTTMSYKDYKVIIQSAVVNIDTLLYSPSGSRCLAECFVYARNGELLALEQIVLSRTVEIAMGQYSNYFLQRAIEYGREPLQVAIADRVAAEVVIVSLDRFGSYVVEACFLLARTPEPLQRLLHAFLHLRGDELTEMVRGTYSNYVVSRLLEAAKNHFPQDARALARLIERLPAAVHREMHARAVMSIVHKLTHKHLRSHATLY